MSDLHNNNKKTHILATPAPESLNSHTLSTEVTLAHLQKEKCGV